MLYRIVRTVNQWYPLAVLWTYLGLFLLAIGLIFVFPLGPIALVFVGLGGLGIVVIASHTLHRIERGLVRRSMASGICPQCRCRYPSDASQSLEWRCTNCGVSFDASGTELQSLADRPM